MRTRRPLVSLLLASALGLTPALALAAEPASPTAAQVKELQDQLAAMKKEMDAMRAELQRQNAPPQGPMMGHMMRMQNHWQMMHDQSCGMRPEGCPGYTAPKQ